jgi:putative nucleotidyltransferase with HDIG domain
MPVLNEEYEDMRWQCQRMSALKTIDQAILSGMDMSLTLGIVLDQVLVVLRADMASILMLEEHSLRLSYASHRGWLNGREFRAPVRLGEGLAGRAAREGRIQRLRAAETPETDERLGRLERDGLRDYYAVPLVSKEQVRGVMEVFFRDRQDRPHAWLEFLETLAGQAAIAVDNCLLFESLQRFNTEMTLAYEATIEGWSRALDLRDRETRDHCQRVTEMTLCLARTMGIDEQELVHVRRGALLHDIGKMGVPDSILLKPGPLTREEMEVVRQHPVYAYNMLAPIDFLRPAMDIPYCHHEKWDGTGYPRGLKGLEIPLAARIFSVADVWDALTSERPYRRAWPDERARRHTVTMSGTHFDPQVVQVFLEIMDRQRGLMRDSPLSMAA